MCLFSDKENSLSQEETQEWIDALKSVLKYSGSNSVKELLEILIKTARKANVEISLQNSLNTPYVNTIHHKNQPLYPGDLDIERKIRSYVRWNAMAMVVRANKYKIDDGGDLGGHIASFASFATLIECGQNHFWHGGFNEEESDLIYFQGHSAPGIYARAYLEGRLTENQLDHFRQEIDGNGLSSYPHPILMPKFWQFPTVSMGLGPIIGIYQARFLKYLHARGIANTITRKVWVLCGDGEMDEPESIGALSIASREKLDNLIFIVNCNLQRLDGPVRGNGKIIQELERIFIGNGWNVIKLIWGGRWDNLLDQDVDGCLRKNMESTSDGEYQTYGANNGDFIRKNFFGKNSNLIHMVSKMNDAEIRSLNRGGHDPIKIYAAFSKAHNHQGQPTVILAKTVKGYGMGEFAESINLSHQQKKMDIKYVREFRDKFFIPISDKDVDMLPYIKFDDSSKEAKYLLERRKELGGFLPKRREHPTRKIKIPKLDVFDSVLTPSSKPISTTQGFVRILNLLLRDTELGKRIVPILVDESRTFGMEGLFRKIGIYSPEGQNYIPVDNNQIIVYRETKDGQLLQEGINEAGAMSSWIAAATSYSSNNQIMVPFYIYYSMFGFQRFGDIAWAAADMKSRGFLLGGTSGRTTLNGEGLQHADGHSHILSSVIPNCLSYDPAYLHELTVIIQNGLERMVTLQENIFYYITLNNENYSHPGLNKSDKDGILKGFYKIKSIGESLNRVQLLGSGSILKEVLGAQELLEKDWNISSDCWSVTSFSLLRQDGLDADRFNLLHPNSVQKIPFFTQQLAQTYGPIIAATDYIKLFPDQVRQFIPCGRLYRVLGTDGFGRSDFRNKLREHFEISKYFIVVAAMRALADCNMIEEKKIDEAISLYKINKRKSNPMENK